MCLFVCFLYPFAISFAYMLAYSFFVACTHLEQGHLGREHNLLGVSNKGKDVSKKMQAQKGKCSVD